MKIENWKLKIADFIKANWLIITILVVGTFLRLYKISSYMIFLGDEGRDAIVVRNLIVYADPILIGPGTSIGGMYLGPLYYYFMAPFLFLSNFSPVGPAIGVALLGIATIWLVYFVCKEWFSVENEKISIAGTIASLFYAVSPTVINFSRSSWNPNIMPFFSLLTIYSIWRVWKKDDNKFLIITAISFAFVLQSHYLGLLLTPVIAIIWLIKYFQPAKKDRFINRSVLALLVFLFLMSPLLIFDIRHNWMNLTAMRTFFTERQATVSIKPWNALPKIPKMATDIITSLVTGKNIKVGEIVLVIISIPSLLMLLGRKKLHPNEASGFFMLFLWIVFGLIGFGLYKQQIYDHYYGFLFTAPFILIGGFVEDVLENSSKIGMYVLIFGFLALFYLNIINNPLRFNPNNQMKRAENVANKIIEESQNKKFNIAVVADRNYEDGYQYFLEKENSKMINIDAQIVDSITDQLFVICEKVKESCDPTHSSKAEVANFGWSKIENDWNVDGVTIYKLIHTK